MTTVCHSQLTFVKIDSRLVIAEFSAGHMTSDAGCLLLRKIDQATGLVASLSQVLDDPRDPSKVRCEQQELLRQRFFSIALGYEDRSGPGCLNSYLRF